MLFNTFTFIFLFFPITTIFFFAIARSSHRLAAAWLACASLFFYGWWNIYYIPLLLGSIGFNYWAGWRIGHTNGRAKFRCLSLAIAADLALLCYFKYADFYISSVNFLANIEISALNIILPIGISFFTFTQIAFLVDTYQGKVSEYRFVHYLLFVTYFPHLVAGPVLHHKEMMPQFDAPATYRISSKNIAVGLSIFATGLAKKVLIADNLAPHASFFFDATDTPSLLIAWGGVLAYAFQLYFDFSGYSDMAIGLSRVFNIKLPLNFNSPYKAANIIEFWRRWHITLSRFLRDYLYVALGGNRKGPIRRYTNLMTTMVLGGLWHGAGWNFVIWGALHGSYLMINHAWMAFTIRLGIRNSFHRWNFFSIALTFIVVCFSWVFFRATDIHRAMTITQGMLGGFGIGIPETIGSRLGQLKPWLEQWGVSFYLGGGTRFIQTYTWVIVGAAIAFLLPNTQQIMDKFEPALDYVSSRDRLSGRFAEYIKWQPNFRWAFWIAIIVVASLLSLSRPAEFLYFQF